MLTETFLHLPGIGDKREAGLWRRGIETWKDLNERRVLNSEVLSVHDLLMAELEQGGLRVIAGCLRPSEHWRALCLDMQSGQSLPSRWLALDIETTGCGHGRDHVTTIGVCGHPTDFRPVALSWGDEDMIERLQALLDSTDTLITFFGNGFDVPFLTQQYPHLRWPPFHVDLAAVLRRLGIKGGLKRIQKQQGLCRPGNLEEADGYTAVLLWQAHRRGFPTAMETLVRYCLEDVVVLLPLAVLAYERLAGAIGRGWRCWQPPQVDLDVMPYDPDLVRRVNCWRRDKKKKRSHPSDKVVIVDESGVARGHPGYRTK